MCKRDSACFVLFFNFSMPGSFLWPCFEHLRGHSTEELWRFGFDWMNMEEFVEKISGKLKDLKRFNQSARLETTHSFQWLENLQVVIPNNFWNLPGQRTQKVHCAVASPERKVQAEIKSAPVGRSTNSPFRFLHRWTTMHFLLSKISRFVNFTLPNVVRSDRLLLNFREWLESRFDSLEAQNTS